MKRAERHDCSRSGIGLPAQVERISLNQVSGGHQSRFADNHLPSFVTDVNMLNYL